MAPKDSQLRFPLEAQRPSLLLLSLAHLIPTMILQVQIFSTSLLFLTVFPSILSPLCLSVDLQTHSYLCFFSLFPCSFRLITNICVACIFFSAQFHVDNLMVFPCLFSFNDVNNYAKPTCFRYLNLRFLQLIERCASMELPLNISLFGFF